MKRKKQTKSNKEKKEKQITRRRYHDMRLVWFVLALTIVFLGLRALIRLYFDKPVFSVLHNSGDDDYETFEMWLVLFEVFAGGIALCLFDAEPPSNDGKYKVEDSPVSIRIMNIAILIFPCIIEFTNAIFWGPYIALVLALSVYIGKVPGFGLPLGRQQVIHTIGASKDCTIPNKYGGTYYFPGYSSCFLAVIFLAGITGLLILSLSKII